jgi:acyl-[acyl-carrier-protein]-phospholipid O-acyltransferase/long-chain-fatty-acid--[acyl-carrier-protein] ligase
MVGILLPPSVAGALVNFAALLMGKAPVNLNYTASEEVLASCIQQCGITTVLSSEAFLDKIKLRLPCRVVKIEDLAAKPRAAEKAVALFAGLFLPVGRLERFLGSARPPSMDDLATVIFSSGSTGDPKGVMLTHRNIAANVEQVRRLFAFTPEDRFLGILPFFHSFGFMGTLMLTATTGMGAVYYPNPRDGKTIGELVRKQSVSFVISTPTFLQLYLRQCGPEDFKSVRIVLTGAEKLPPRLAAAFEEKFGIRPIEGYGCTECAPVVATSHPDQVLGTQVRRGHKPGSVGRPLPGMSVRVVDPDTCEPVAEGEAGMLVVKGPNVMKGYLDRPDLTAEVLRDGWYTTGDIVAMDAEGFIHITDRLSRFSKLGGEMVPHLKIEETLHELAGVTEQVFAVTGIEDAKKGERLAVLHTLADADLKQVLEGLQQTDLPNLWRPRPNAFFRVEALPVLGTGKLDLKRVRALAVEFGSGEVSALA